MTGPAERSIVCWVPDWPVRASIAEHGDDPAIPLALLSARRVVACSASARAQGVRAGMREREAQALAPKLVLRSHDPGVDERRFGPVFAAISRVAPGGNPLRPGLCALRARGPARYYGGEAAAAAAIRDAAGFEGCRVGVADGVFAAEQAARAAEETPGLTSPDRGIRISTHGGAAEFLRPLPIERAAEPELARLLRGIGVRTLGALAALPEAAVRERFGPAGLSAHRRARAAAPAHGSEVRPGPEPRDFTVAVEFETPLDGAEQLAFACARHAGHFIDGLHEERLVCTSLSIELTDDLGIRHERFWAHPRRFTEVDVVNRIRWQADGVPRDPERGGAGIVRVRIVPADTDRAAAHEPALWNSEPDARVHHRFTQVQAKLGHGELGTSELGGGRLLVERQRFVPWSTPRDGRDAGPWPGALPAPRPTAVFPRPIPVALTGADGSPVRVGADDLLDEAPAMLTLPHEAPRAVRAWSAPWPLRERWWEGRPPRARLQLETEDGAAWLLLREGADWFAEGRYD